MRRIYYRTKDGRIGNIIGEIKSLIDDNRYFELSDKTIVKYEDFLDSILQTSPEIIDLIQPGDYVNDRYVFKKLKNTISVENSDFVNGIQYLTNDEIESVLTSEEIHKRTYYVEYE